MLVLATVTVLGIHDSSVDESIVVMTSSFSTKSTQLELESKFFIYAPLNTEG